MIKKLPLGLTTIATLFTIGFTSTAALAKDEVQSGGLSVENAQNFICAGTYGGREWSTSQRQAACQRVGKNYTPIHPLIVVSAALLVITVVGYVFYRYKTKRKSAKKKSAKSRLLHY